MIQNLKKKTNLFDILLFRGLIQELLLEANKIEVDLPKIEDKVANGRNM